MKESTKDAIAEVLAEVIVMFIDVGIAWYIYNIWLAEPFGWIQFNYWQVFAILILVKIIFKRE